tara:strand:+ start:23 stop:391 length:369 start_codon:yes stop_codon:yes gene_type:complete
MLGFSSISEVAIANQPGATLFLEGVSGTAAVNTNLVVIEAAANVTVDAQNLAMTTTSGELASITGTAVVPLTGISATLSQGDVLVWGEILPGITTNYTNITTGASQTWTEISTGVSQTWTEI